MQHPKELATQVRETWKTARQVFESNTALLGSIVPGLSITDIDELFVALSVWANQLKIPTKAKSLQRIAIELASTSLASVQTFLTQVIAGQHGAMTQVIRECVYALAAIHTVYSLGSKVSDTSVATLTSQQAEAVAQLEVSNAKIDAVVTKVQDAEQRYEALENIQKNAADIDAGISKNKQSVDAIYAQIVAIRETLQTTTSTAEAKKETIDALAARSETLSTGIRDGLQNLGIINDDLKELKAKIEALLPGATSVSLAHTFAARSKEESNTKWIWLTGFVISIIALLYVEYHYLPASGQATTEYLISLIHALPFAAPLIWVAWFFARQFGHASRIQEDYANKQSLSGVFEGYKKQMADMGDNGKALSRLTDVVIDAISKDPLRVFNRKQDEHPVQEAAKIIGELAGGDKVLGKLGGE